MTDTCKWTDSLGNTYTYSVYAAGGTWSDVPGGYIMAKLNSGNRWVALYIGQADSFKNRSIEGQQHDGWKCARARGATHIHARVNNDEKARLLEEKRLIQTYNPPCNTQHRT